MSITLTPSPAKPYLQKRHLLIQFIASELFRVHQELVSIQNLLSNNILTVKAILPHIHKLIGTHHGYASRPIGGNDGIFAKLRNCTALFHLSDVQGKPSQQIYRSVNLVWIEAEQIMEYLKLLPANEVVDLTILNPLLNKLMEELDKFSRNLKGFFEEFKDNENVVLFIVNHHSQLDAIYGKRFVKKWLHKMYQTETYHFLSNRYIARGFEHLIPIIQEKLTTINDS